MPELTSYLKGILKNVGILNRLNSLAKCYVQERRARTSQYYYGRHARQPLIKQQLSTDIGILLDRKLIDRLGKREIGLVGKLHLFVAFSLTNWESIIPLSLEPYGKVTVFEWSRYGYEDKQSDWLERRDMMNQEMLTAFLTANEDQKIDAVIGYLSGHNTSAETLNKMAATGAVIFNFCWDDKLNFPGKLLGGRYTSPASIANSVDLNLTNAPDSIIKYAAHGGLAMFWPEAAHPGVHRPYEQDFEFDVSFVGASYGWRPRFMANLKKLGINVECFGNGWPNGPLSQEEMIRVYSKSRINLGFAGVGFSRNLMCLKGRDFEIPMSGGLYLTQNNPELSLVYKVGEEILTYKNEDDCATLIKMVLKNPAWAESMRIFGRERTLRDHTYEARWKEIFELSKQAMRNPD